MYKKSSLLRLAEINWEHSDSCSVPAFQPIYDSERLRPHHRSGTEKCTAWFPCGPQALRKPTTIDQRTKTRNHDDTRNHNVSLPCAVVRLRAPKRTPKRNLQELEHVRHCALAGGGLSDPKLIQCSGGRRWQAQQEIPEFLQTNYLLQQQPTLTRQFASCCSGACRSQNPFSHCGEQGQGECTASMRSNKCACCSGAALHPTAGLVGPHPAVGAPPP